MLIQRIIGGLGNQMFQYAFIRALSLRNKVDFKLDILGFERYYKLHKYALDFLNIKQEYVEDIDLPFSERYFVGKNNLLTNSIRFFLRKLNIKYYQEKNSTLFDERFLKIKDGYIVGYFQSEKYFKDFEEYIRKDFIFKDISDKNNLKMANIINKLNNSVSIHIRRGDYLNKNSDMYQCDIEYYKNAIEFIKSKLGENIVLFFFSDDIGWVKEHFDFLKFKKYYIDFNKGKDNYKDMYLMSLCKHNIIANSSFSWWGAWLNNNSNKIVIAPKKWFKNKEFNEYKDIYTEEMVVM